MPKTLPALVRFSAVIGLWLLIGTLILVTYPLHLLGGAGLDLIEKLKAKADELGAKQ
jgi:hypothetical protein